MGIGDAGRPPALLGDEADLFREFNARLVGSVQRRTNAPREMVDDACAFAWQQFLQHQPDRDRNWRAWLMVTAERETWRLHGAEARHLSLSLESDHDGLGTWEVADPRDPVTTRVRLREALQAFARLPERRRNIKALQIAGFSYDEIAQMRGLTYTRVNRLLAEANASLREQQARAAASRVDGPPRAVRLDELERDPPEWLRRAIGAPPDLGRPPRGAGLASRGTGDRRLPPRARTWSRRRSDRPTAGQSRCRARVRSGRGGDRASGRRTIHRPSTRPGPMMEGNDALRAPTRGL